jgi:hypothetical protein
MRTSKAMLNTKPWYLGACLSLCLGLGFGFGFASPVFAQGADAPLSAQERLDAIRQSLVEASLQTPTKVLTTSWIDANGSLRESSSFKNGMEVRGVRVLAYGRDEVGQPKARLQSTTATPSVAKPQTAEPVLATASSKTSLAGVDLSFKGLLQKLKQAVVTQEVPQGPPACTHKAAVSMNHLVSLDLDLDPSSNPLVMNAVFSQLQAHWVEALSPNGSRGQAKPWRAVNNLPPASMSNKMTAYERALVSSRPLAMPWHASLRVRTEVLPSQGLEIPFTFRHPSLALHLDFEMLGTEGQSAKFEDHYSLVIDLVRNEWSPAQLSSESRELIQSQLQTWRTHAEQWLSCQHHTPSVTAVNGQQIEINVGSMVGVKQGDEWLVANPAFFPKELVGKNGAPQTLLARVQSVTPFNSQLVVLAGPVQSVQANWRAWPTETILKEPSLQTASSASYIREATPAKRPLKPLVNSSPGLGAAAY